jgi:hypothetical protein
VDGLAPWAEDRYCRWLTVERWGGGWKAPFVDGGWAGSGSPLPPFVDGGFWLPCNNLARLARRVVWRRTTVFIRQPAIAGSAQESRLHSNLSRAKSNCVFHSLLFLFRPSRPDIGQPIPSRLTYL